MKNPKVKKLIITLSTLSLCLSAAQAFASAEPQARAVESTADFVESGDLSAFPESYKIIFNW